MKNATLKQKQRTAADEFVAHLSENIDTNVSAWKRFVARLKEALLRLGIRVSLTNEDLAALVGRSLARYERMTARGEADAAVKNDIATGVSGGVEVKGDEENQVQFSVMSIANGAGFECDKLAKAGVDAHFDAYLARICDHLGPALAGNVPYGFNNVLVDSWEAGSQNWTQGFDGEFLSRAGYDIRPWLPVHHT